ncbi:hypothetical protein BH23ACT3_BH23ACT3_22760 [soil metagenome]
MAPIITAHALLPGRAGEYREWCRELRSRRSEYGASRTAASIVHAASWLLPDLGLTVIRLDGSDPHTSLRQLDNSDDLFDLWYREHEQHIHGTSLSESATPTELIADHHHAPIDPFDPYMALAIPLLPGRTNDFRRIMQLGVETGHGPERARGWGITRLTVHLQHTGEVDLALYEISGDLPTMVRSVAGDSTRDMDDERNLFRTYFGVDLSAGELPIPEATFAWSATSTP